MRITVNLSHFFADHRSKAKVYVKETMRYIRDLERRISKIFEINDFYLVYENHYLPPLEDVRLLNFDDVVWVVPVSENKLSSEQEPDAEMSAETEEIQPKRKKKKKKKHETPTDEETEVRKRKVKCKNETISASNEETELTAEEKSPITDKIEDSLFKDSGRDSLDSSKCDELSNEAPNVNVKSLVDTFENKKIDFKKHMQLFNNSAGLDMNKRVNIVKTIIVQHHSLTDPNASSNTSMKNETAASSHIPNDASDNTKNHENVMETPKNNLNDLNRENETAASSHIQYDANEKNIKNHENVTETPKNNLNDLSSTYNTSKLDTTLENSCSSSLEGGDFKRKRKRVRKRKHVNKVLESTSTLKKPVYDLIPRPLLASARNPRHVRFEDDSNKQDGTITVIDDSTFKSEEQETSEKTFVEELTERAVPIKAIEKEELTEEFILKQPVMQNMQPRQGDIVAFKVLRMSESYTPEISSRIVGKISSYNPPNSEVVFDIIYGQDQCVQPLGKFSLITEEEAANTSHYNCKWSELLEPRLLFP